MGFGLDGEDGGDLGWVVREVHAVAGADLEHVAGHAGEELGAALAIAGLVHPRAGPGVEAGEQGVADLVGHRQIALVAWVSVRSRAATRPLAAVRTATVTTAPRRPTRSAVIPAMSAPMA